MGNCPATACVKRGSVHNWAEEEGEGMVKVVRVTDGELFEYAGPSVLVKDVVAGFEGFAVFHYDSIKQPLGPDTQLEQSEVYYLRPWKGAAPAPSPPPALKNSVRQGDEAPRPCRTSGSGEDAVRELSSGTAAPRVGSAGEGLPSGKALTAGTRKAGKRVRFADDVIQASSDAMVPAAPPLSVPPHLPLPSPAAPPLQQRHHHILVSNPNTTSSAGPKAGSEVIRVKVVISKKQLLELMQAPAATQLQPRGAQLLPHSAANALLDTLVAPFLPPNLACIVASSCPTTTCP